MPRRKARKIKVGLVKALAEWGRPDANLALIERVTRKLKGARLDVLITPECFLDGYMIRRKSWTRARLKACAVSGPKDARLDGVRALARRLKSYVLFGATQHGPGRVFRNAAYLLNRRGRCVGTYYKVHTNRPYSPGDELPVFRTDFGVVGVLICADRRWPENARCLRLKGAEILLIPTWGWYGEMNTAVMRTRAYENGIPVCFAHPRQALVCAADGSVDAVLESERPGVLVRKIDLRHNIGTGSTRNRANSHPVQNRRPDLYGPIVRRR